MNYDWRYLRWRYYKAKRHLLRLFCRNFYRDTADGTDKSILIAGTGRSGTTWLADLVASEISGRIMFEPFHSKKVTEFSDYYYFQYMRPAEEDRVLSSYCANVFNGDIRNRWIDRQVEVLAPKYRVIKEIRANLFLRWIKNVFPEVRQIFIIRHPCAVVWSRMALNWDTDKDIEPFLSQPKLVDDFLSKKIEVIEGAASPEEKHAVVWCISNLVPLKQDSAGELHVIFYEHMVMQPEIEVPRLFAALEQPYSNATYARLMQPSTTAQKDSAIVNDRNRVSHWQNKLSAKQVTRILRIVEAFGMDQIYTDDPLPLSEWWLEFDRENGDK